MSELGFDKWVVISNLQTTLNNYTNATNNTKLFVASLIGKEIRVKYNKNPISWLFPFKLIIDETFIKNMFGDRFHAANVKAFEPTITKIKQKIEWLKASIDREVRFSFEEFREIDNYLLNSIEAQNLTKYQEETVRDLEKCIWI